MMIWPNCHTLDTGVEFASQLLYEVFSHASKSEKIRMRERLFSGEKSELCVFMLTLLRDCFKHLLNFQPRFTNAGSSTPWKTTRTPSPLIIYKCNGRCCNWYEGGRRWYVCMRIYATTFSPLSYKTTVQWFIVIWSQQRYVNLRFLLFFSKVT